MAKNNKEQTESVSAHLAFCRRVDAISQRYGAKNAVTYMGEQGHDQKLTFQEISAFIHSAKKEFEHIGLARGDRAAIISPHSPWAVFVGVALAYSGITIVLIDAALPREEMGSLLDHSDVRAVFTTENLYHQLDCYAAPGIPFFSLDKGLEIIPFNRTPGGCLGLPAAKDADEDVIAILYSSGTTGQMKGVMVTYESVLRARKVFVRLSGLKDYMTYLLVLPFNHIAGFTGAMTFFLTGCELGFIENADPSKLQSSLLKFQPYYFAMVPKVYQVMEQKIRASVRAKGRTAALLMDLLLNMSGFSRKHLGINIGRILFRPVTAQVFGKNIFGIGTGASPCPPETAGFFLNLGLEWANLYATTETGVPIAATGVHDRYPVGTVGNVDRHPEIQIRIGDPDENGIGEIQVRSRLMMKGYFRRPDLTGQAFEDGYFKTGDYGYIDKKRNLHITGRIKESIVLGNGKKVSPADVDEYYSARHPGYILACRGIPVHEGLEDEIHLFVQIPEGGPDLREQMRRSLEKTSRNAEAMYQVRKIHFIDKIPMTTIGKVKRHLLTVSHLPKTDPQTQTQDQAAQIHKELADIIREALPGDDADLIVSGEMELKADLGMDSLSVFGLCAALDQRYGISLEEKLHEHITVREVQALLQGHGRTKAVSEKSASACGENTLSPDMSLFPAGRTLKMNLRLKKWLALSRLIYHFEVSGLEHIPRESSFILCANHASFFDPLWILAAMGSSRFSPDKLACLAAAEIFYGDRKFSDMLGGVPVDREGNTAPALKRIRECLEDGYMVILFPEGARSRDGSMLPFKNGAAMLAADTGRPILPVRIDGAFEIFPRHQKYPALWDRQNRRKFRLDIRFGRPIEPQGHTVQELTGLLRKTIEEM